MRLQTIGNITWTWLQQLSNDEKMDTNGGSELTENLVY